MGKYFFTFFLLLFLFFPAKSFAQNPSTQFAPEAPQEDVYIARVEEIIKEGSKKYGSSDNPFQVVTVSIISGDKKGTKLTIDHGTLFTVKKDMLVRKNEKVVLLSYKKPDGTDEFTIVEKYRLDKLIAIAVSFFFLIVALSRLKGLGSIIGLCFSLILIMKWIVPQILAGKDPLTITLLGCTLIMATTIFLAHGFSRKTLVAVASTACTFVITGILSLVFASMAKLSGLGTDDAYSLQFGLGELNFRGLFLSGMIIGTLGVLDDITTSLSASIFELAHTQHYGHFSSLFGAGFRIGKEHISSLVNTLVLAYAGSSLPLMLFIVINPSQKPLWSIVNSEVLAEEIIRSLVGSFSLVLAVPITAVLASYIALRKYKT